LYSDINREILEKRILLVDASGTPLETREEMFSRVARHVAAAERRVILSPDVQVIADAFFRMMRDSDFLPDSPTLVNAGLTTAQLSGCFVLPIEDSMDSIFSGVRAMALIQKTGGGTGFSFSKLRPRSDSIGSGRNAAA
jgi:ribonucleoside-diphosphate reductase alpha chain